MDEDKGKICNWIMQMDVESFYELCVCLSDAYEFTGEQLFYSCELCDKEHGNECEYSLGKCYEFFKKHYEEMKQ